MVAPPRKSLLKHPADAPERVASRPAWIEPCLPQLVTAAPSGSGWMHEIKHGGYRAVSVVEVGAAPRISSARTASLTSSPFTPRLHAAAHTKFPGSNLAFSRDRDGANLVARTYDACRYSSDV